MQQVSPIAGRWGEGGSIVLGPGGRSRSTVLGPQERSRSTVLCNDFQSIERDRSTVLGRRVDQQFLDLGVSTCSWLKVKGG